MNKLTLSQSQVGRFAVVKLWPKIKTAEDECIARLKMAAKFLGIECVEIHANGERLDKPDVFISRADVDFVIHLHYDTPKLYDAYSFVALWNPLQFYHEWGYARTSRNLITHDDFLSCGCQSADDHVSRMIRNQPTHLKPFFKLFHSTPDVDNPPSLGNFQIFYAGINWEAINGGKSRHQEVLKELDETGLLRIYGPEIFQGVRVWAGYKSYVREIPFDGISMMGEIANAGIALVLSSQAHKDAGLMSNRLFESIAAGALIICDENPFAVKHFGDSLLYIDGRLPATRIALDITNHVNWAKTHPQQALAKVSKSQDVFRTSFTLKKNLAYIYQNLDARKKALAIERNPSGKALKVRVYFLMPEFSEALLANHLNSIARQEYSEFQPTLIVDKYISGRHRSKLEAAIPSKDIGLVEIDYRRHGLNDEIITPRKWGEVLLELINIPDSAEALMFVAPNEKIFSNHVAILAEALQRDPQVDCAATAAILENGRDPSQTVHELIDFGAPDVNSPSGYGRFIFRKSGIPKDINIAIPYLDIRPIAVLVGESHLAQQMSATVVIDVKIDFPGKDLNKAAEIKIIEDFCPDVFIIKPGFGPKPLYAKLRNEESTVNRVSFGQFLILLTDYRWVKLQINELRRQGFFARVKVFRQVFGL